MSRTTKIFAVIAVVGGILALSIGSIAFAAEPNTSVVCGETGVMTRLHAQGTTCDGTCEDPLQTQTHARLQIQDPACDAIDCVGECEDQLQTQTRIHEQLQLTTCDATCLLAEDGTGPEALGGSVNQFGKKG
jgi:hypothetical protein